MNRERNQQKNKDEDNKVDFSDSRVSIRILSLLAEFASIILMETTTVAPNT